MIKKQVELLAPAGNKEAFIGAINAGANAVYISGKNFGARKYANNFELNEIVDLIKYAHIRNVLVYVTVNTLIFENEINELIKYTDFLVRNHVDALIVQDIGIIEYFIKRYPNTEIHASTQMNVYNIEQLKYLKELGVKRVILARETSIDTIKEMKRQIDIDLEIFVHGALCVSYSGNCLFSSMNGGRSGNRGECAQPCRLKYSLHKDNEQVEESSYLMSTKDLMTINNIDKIINSGVASLKIEGRMKKPEYVIATVRAYREAIDNYQKNTIFNIEERIDELLSVFNREYTDGYLLNIKPFSINNSFRPNHQGIEIGKVIEYKNGKTKIKLSGSLSIGDGIRIIGKSDLGGQVNKIIKNGVPVKIAYSNDEIIIDLPKSVSVNSLVMKTQDSELENSLVKYLQPNYNLIPLNGEMIIVTNEKIKLEFFTSFSDKIQIESDYIVEESKNKNQTKEIIYNQFDKFGNTCYYLNDFSVITDNQGFIPNNVLNTLRRDAITLLENIVLTKEERIIRDLDINLNIAIPNQKFSFIVKVETTEQLQAAKELNIENIYINEKLINQDENQYLLQNRIWSDKSTYISRKKLVIQDFGGINLINGDIIANYPMNITNSLSCISLFNKGIKRICLSPENTIENISNIIQGFKNITNSMPNLEYIVYGRLDLMLSKYCPITKSMGVFKENCNLCMHNQYYLVDESKNKYPIIRDTLCNIRILHNKPLLLFKYLKDLKQVGINTFRLDFTDENYYETKRIIQAFQKNDFRKIDDIDYTVGRINK
jgi:putative protease